MSSDNDPMAEIRASFFIECEELLEALQDGLQVIEDGADDAETINVVFRAVHSIKGGAGAFGLEGLVRFAHRYETAMDAVRTGALQIDEGALKLFFRAADHLSDLVRMSRDDTPLDDAVTATLLTELDTFLGEDAPEATPEAEVIDFQPMGLTLDLDLDGEEDEAGLMELPDLDGLPPPALVDANPLPHQIFQITFTPSAELFETGNEPAILLRNLQELGTCDVVCDTSALPHLASITPEIPHLSWRITLHTSADESEIASVFEFVEGLCALEIAPLNQGIPERLTASEPCEEGQALGEAVSPPTLNPAPETPPTSQSVEVTPRSESGQVSAEKARARRPANAAAAAKSVVRVDLDRIERLVNLVGELVINQAMLSQSLEKSGLSPHSEAISGLEDFQRLTRDIQDSVMMIRAQPVKSLFQRMSRIVREASGAVGKDVRLHTSGEATEVDKTVIERLADPLTHMIRNAVDHGLEPPQDRMAAGKPAQGRVNLTAAHRSGRVVIEVSDDGAGINRKEVLEIAVTKGLIPADAALSDTEIDNLLFLPGFSTASVVSDLSGRGVGMDVVRTAIQALGGRITITSTPGEGTIFSISLPLTLAVLDGMVIEVAGETLVLPLNLVVETMTLTQNDVQLVRPGRQVIEVRSGFVPLFDLGHALGYRPPLDSFDAAVVLLIAYDDENSVAIVIDNIVDQRQVVIKGLDESLYRAPGIAAATILGDGRIALILDPSDIIATYGTEAPLQQVAQSTGISA